MELTRDQREFIDDFAALWEQLGANVTQGRTLALLYISVEAELSAADIAEALGVSRGSVSQITRQLIQLRMIQRVSRRGDRRDYFRVAANPFGEAARLERSAIHTLLDLFQRGLNLHNTSPPESRHAFINSIAFLEDYHAALGEFLDTWKPRKEPETQ